MFTKLLKHDFRAVRGILGLLCLICLGSGVLGCGALRVLEGLEGNDLLLFLAVLAVMAGALSLIISGVATQFVTLAHFYQSRFTDRGYLTFTLPVTNHENILSAYVNCIIGCVIGMATVCVSFLTMLFFGIQELDGQRLSLLENLFPTIGNVLDLFGWGNAAMTATYLIIGILTEELVIMLAITIGSVLARKHKILAAVAVYYGIHMGMSLVMTLAGLLPLAVVAGNTPSEAADGSVYAALMVPQILITLAIGLGSYFLMHYLVSKKLNLN